MGVLGNFSDKKGEFCLMQIPGSKLACSQSCGMAEKCELPLEPEGLVPLTRNHLKDWLHEGTSNFYLGFLPVHSQFYHEMDLLEGNIC